MSIPATARQAVRERAADRCEYCRMRQEWEAFYPYHIEHIVAQQHRGSDDLGNLLKGPNLTGLDPDGDHLVRLFHPRTQHWHEHFRMENGYIIGQTDVGRTTVFLLEMNSPHRLELRMVNVSDW